MSLYKKWFSALDNSLANTDEALDSELFFKIRSSLNALYEGIFDKAVSGTQEVKGHDHTKSPSSPYYGGALLGRNQVYIGSNAYKSPSGLFFGTVTTASTWYPADNGWASDFSRSGNALPMIFAYCSQGWNTGGSGVPTSSDKPYLTGWARVLWTPVSHPSTLSLRVVSIDLARNGGTNTVNSLSTSLQQVWVPLDLIPCQAGWNDFDLEVTSSNNNQDFSIDPVVLYEDPSLIIPSGTNKIGIVA